MLIVIEGLDGSGKSTQVNKLRKYLKTRATDLEYIHFPRYDAPVYGDLISKFLRGGFGDINQVHPQLVALLYAEDRHEALGELAMADDDETIVLLDRYVYSNVAYQCAKVSDHKERKELKKWIIDTEFGDFELPKPDINIFLDVPLTFVEKKLESNRKGHDRDYLDGQQDIHEANISFQQKVREVYLDLCGHDRHFTRIDCSDGNGQMLDPETIFDKIKEVLDEKIL